MRGLMVTSASIKFLGRRYYGRFPGCCVRVCCGLFLALCALVVLSANSWSAPLTGTAGSADWKEFDQFVAAAETLMLSHPEAALAKAHAAADIARRNQNAPRYRLSEATALWLEAEALTRTLRVSEARVAANKASLLVSADGRMTKLDGDLALSRARIAESTGDVANAMKNYQQAHAVFAKLGIARSQALALLGLGDLYEKARDFDREIGYYREAAQIYPNDPAIAVAVSNNLGFAYQQMGRYGEAIPRFQRALDLAKSLHSPMLQASILNNLAFSYARLQKLTEAEHAADRALILLRRQDEGEEARFAWGAKAEIAYRRGDLHTAAVDMQKVFDGVNLKTTTPRFRDLHRIAYVVYRKKGDLPHALVHLEAFKRLDDEGRSLAASANFALLGARFDFARQGLEIARLRSAELERDIKLRKSQSELALIVFISIILAGILLLSWIAWRNALLKRHRNDIAQKNRELVKTLGERNVEIERRIETESQLRVAAESAQQASRAKSHFLANMSHELRTPLNAIIGFSELMASGRAKPEKTQEYAGNIMEGGRHLLAVLNNVLDMARIESGKMELEEQRVRLGDIVEDALSVLGCRETYASKEFRLIGDHDLFVRGDAVRLKQAIINLVFNAVKFTGECGRVNVRIEAVADGVDLVVEDDGQGIPADKLPLIMEPFGQAENTYARAHGGAGLGLPIVKSLVELHGGRFTIESKVGQGTNARIHLPTERLASADKGTGNDIEAMHIASAA